MGSWAICSTGNPSGPLTYLQHVTRRASDERTVAGVGRPERLAQARNVDLHDVPSRRGRFVGPQRLDEAIRRHDLAGVRQQCPLLRPSELKPVTVCADLSRPKNAEVHACRLKRPCHDSTRAVAPLSPSEQTRPRRRETWPARGWLVTSPVRVRPGLGSRGNDGGCDVLERTSPNYPGREGGSLP